MKMLPCLGGYLDNAIGCEGGAGMHGSATVGRPGARET
jgi:hypothetical protein